MAGKYRLALGIAYCGQPWHGWQKQPHQQTVQDQLEQALESFLNVPCETICAGRTDTGVHAFEQVVHLDTAVPRPEQAFVRGLNALLPQSIRIQWALKVDREFMTINAVTLLALAASAIRVSNAIVRLTTIQEYHEKRITALEQRTGGVIRHGEQ